MADNSSIDPPIPPVQHDPFADGAAAPGSHADNLAPPDVEPGTAEVRHAPKRRWIPWIAALALLVAACAMALWLGKLITTERTLRSVERAATATPAPLEVAAADGLPAADAVVAGETTVNPSANLPADVSQTESASAATQPAIDAAVPVAADAAAAAAGAAAPGAPARAAPPAPPPGTSGAGSVGDAGSSLAAAPVEREAVGKGLVAKKEGKRGARQAKRAPAKMRKARNDTFKRCPPLGKSGAVMCRWHICNGAAGKEKVCRPYLERKP